MILKRASLSLCVLFLALSPHALYCADDFADGNGNDNTNNDNKQRTFLYDAPQQNFQPPSDLRINRFYLELYNRKQQIKDIKVKDQSVNRELQEFNDLAIATDVKRIPFKPLDFIQVHPSLPTTITLPNDLLITYVDVQPETVIPQYDFNFLEIKPTPELSKCAITLKYVYDKDTKQKKQVHTMKLIVDRYTQSNDNDKTLYTMIEYVREDKIDPTDLLELYYKKFGDYPKNNDAITVNGRAYQFIEDPINGVVSIENKKYRIKRGN